AVVRNPQTRAHAEFSRLQGAEIRTYEGARGAALAIGHAKVDRVRARLQGDPIYEIPPGASSLLGVLWHLNALLELKDQIDRGETSRPDAIVVGAGTCGTAAGLLAGLQVANIRTRLIAVRAADPIVCNRARIVRLANGALRALRFPKRVTRKDF